MKEIDKSIRPLIIQAIERDHTIGEQAGGSGHLSFVSYRLNEFSVREIPEGYEVDYAYTLDIETEFSYEPDNPGPQYDFRKTIKLDRNLGLIQETSTS